MKFEHIGIEVYDLYKIELFYKKYFGFKTSYRYKSINTKNLRTVMLKKNNIKLELLNRKNKKNESSKKMIYHISFKVKDINKEYKRLSKFPELKINSCKKTGDGFKEIEIEDPEGNFIEISKRISSKPKYPVKGVIFDLDGTLIDSEPNYYEADKKLLEGYNIEFSKKDKEKYVGIGNLEMMKQLKKKYNINDTVQNMIDKKNKFYLDIALNDTKIFPEMFKFLKKLKKNNYPVAIASGSSPVILDKLLDKLDLKKYFDVIVSAETVKRSKPHPDVFIKAKELMNINEENIVVLEDSTHGVQAAKRAFMKCIGIPYLRKEKIDDDFLMTDLLFKKGMKEFSCKKAFKWIKSF